VTKYDYLAIAVLIALMVWKAAEKFPQLRLSAWGGIVSFFALAIVGLFYVKWSPYYATALAAAQDHTLGASIVSGDLPAAPEVSWQAGFAYSIAYLKQTWQALLLALALGAGIEVLLPPARLSQFFAGSMGPLRATAFAIPSMMCTCCGAPVAIGMIETGAGASSALVYWLANPVLNPAALVFIGFVLGWQWAALRLLVGAALVFVIANLAARFVSADWHPPGVVNRPDNANRPLLLAWGDGFLRLAVRLVPEYAVLVFALGMIRAWFFPEITPAIGNSFWLAPVLAATGTLFVIPGRSTDYPGPTAIRPRRGGRRRIANHLASGEPTVARNVGTGVADARTHRARLRNIRLWPVRCSRGGSSGTIVGSLDVCFWQILLQKSLKAGR